TQGWVAAPTDGTFYVTMGPDTSDDWIPTIGYLSGFEYRRFEPNAKPVWLPLRLPGQYYDPETDLFENWNRYYDASMGRYLGPEPLVEEPEALLMRAEEGRSLSIYSYASNRPLYFVDPDGRQDNPAIDQRGAAAGELGRECAGSDECIEKLKEIGAAVSQVAAFGPEGLVDQAPDVAAATDDAAGIVAAVIGEGELSPEAVRAIKNLEKEITKHQSKITALKENPTVRPGMENMPKEAQAAQVERRLGHLEREISAFKKNIADILHGRVKLTPRGGR
ncbi:RHS repeat domain-containing protein, partial [Corallococcus aberystwythensis]